VEVTWGEAAGRARQFDYLNSKVTQMILSVSPMMILGGTVHTAALILKSTLNISRLDQPTQPMCVCSASASAGLGGTEHSELNWTSQLANGTPQFLLGSQILKRKCWHPISNLLGKRIAQTAAKTFQNVLHVSPADGTAQLTTATFKTNIDKRGRSKYDHTQMGLERE
jgi:hypothetical protein